MMASMGPTFPPHPGAMQTHPGLPPGHPGMAPGMAHNPSQPGVQQGVMPQHLAHMGVSGAGPQINPAAMMGGMPPGAGPNAHAMQHLNPQAQFLQQQQQMNPMAFSNQLQAQMHQQRLQQLQQQQQARQMLMTSHMYQQGVPMAAGPGMNQAQMMAMRQRMAAQAQAQAVQAQQHPQGHPASTQAMIAQQLAMQQQQVANNQMGGGHNAGQPGQMNPQLQQAQQMAALQAQQAAHQAQVQAAAAQQQQQQQQQSQAQGQPQPQQGQPQPQTPQQQNQAGPSANVAQPNQAQNQAQTPQQAAQQPPQGQQQPPQPGQAQPTQLAVQQAQQQALATNLMQQQQKREGMKGHCLLKLMQFGEHLTGFPGSKGKDDVSYWTDFVHRFFSPRGIFRHAIHSIDGEDGNDKPYEIPFPALPRYFHMYFDSGVKNMQLIMDKGTTDRPLPGDCHWIENTKASLVYWFDGGSHVVTTGTLRAQFDAEQRFDLFEFLCTGHEEYLSRRLVIEAAIPQHNWVKEWHKVNSQDPKQSPEMSKKGKAKTLKSPQNPPPDLDLPESVVISKTGITPSVNQFLEIVEIMGQMNPLFGFYHSHPGLSAYAALDQYVASINAAGQNMNGQAIVQGVPRTPSFSQFPMGSSPHASHIQLPESPHMGSPAQGTMQAPGMHPSQSQQGTSSSGPSANTSPAGTKRRRPSAVKTEDEMNTPASAPTPSGGPQVNGIQSKAKQTTPRMGKKQKVSAAQ